MANAFDQVFTPSGNAFDAIFASKNAFDEVFGEGYKATLSNELGNLGKAAVSLSAPLITYPTAIGSALLNTAIRKDSLPHETSADIFRRERAASEEKSAEMLKMYEPQEGSGGAKLMKPIGAVFNALTEAGREVLGTTADMMGLSKESFLRELMQTGGELAAFELAGKSVKAGKTTVVDAAKSLQRGLEAKAFEARGNIPVVENAPPSTATPIITRATPQSEIDRLKNEDLRAEEVLGLEARQGIKAASVFDEVFKDVAAKPVSAFDEVFKDEPQRGPGPIPQRKIAEAPRVQTVTEPSLEAAPAEKPPAPLPQTPAATVGETGEAKSGGSLPTRDIFDTLKDIGDRFEEITYPTGEGLSSAPKGAGQNLVTYLKDQGGVNLGDYSDTGRGKYQRGGKDRSRELHPDIGTVSNRASKETMDTVAQSLNANGWVNPLGGEWTPDAVFEVLSSGKGRDVMRPDLDAISPREQVKLDAQEAAHIENLMSKDRTAGAVIKDVGEALGGKVGMQVETVERSLSRLAAEKRLKEDVIRWQGEAEAAGKTLEAYMKALGIPAVHIDNLMKLAPPVQPQAQQQRPAGQTGIKVDVIAEERAARGAPEIEKPAWTTQEAWDEGQRRAFNDPNYAKGLASDIVAKPRNISAEETNALITHRQQLEGERNWYEKKIADAVDKGEIDYASTLQKTLENLEADLDLNDRAGMLSGAEWAKTGQARQNMIAEDFSRAAMIRKYKAITLEAPSKEMEAKLASYSEKIIDLQNQVRNFEAEKTSKIAGAEIRKLVNEVAKEKRQQGRAIAKEVLDNEFSSLAKAAAKAMGSQSTFHAGVPTEVVSIIGKMAKNRVESGIITVEGVVDSIVTELKNIGIGLSAREVRDAISGYGVFKGLDPDPIKKTLRDLRGQMQNLSKLEDLRAKTPPAKTGVERRVPSDVERELIRKVNEAKKEFAIETTDPATQLKSAQDALETRLNNSIADITKEIETGEFAPSKTGVKYEAEAQRLKEYRDNLAEVRDSIKATFEAAGIIEPTGKIETPKEAKLAAHKREVTMEQRIAAAVKAAERATAKYSRMAAEGDLYPAKTKRALIETPELADARQLKEDIKAYVNELRDIANPKLTPEQIAEKRYKTLLTKKIAETERKLKEGDFVKPEKKVRTLSQSELDLKYQLEEAMAEYHDAQVKWKMENRTKLQKFGGGIAEAANFTRAMKTSFDLSAVLRQGGIISISHPTRGIKSIPDMIESLKSEKGRFAVETAIRNSPNYHLMKQGGLFLSDHTAKSLLKAEEAYMSRLSGKALRVKGVDINPLAASERAYTAFLDSLRASSFDAMLKDLTKNGTDATPGELKAIANYINVATGRGKVGETGTLKALATMNAVFFAPRFVLSRFQMILGQPLLQRDMGRARYLIAKEYGRFLGGAATVIALATAAGGELENDGKIKFGKTRIDIFSGMAQSAVFLGREGMQVANSLAKTSGRRKPFPVNVFDRRRKADKDALSIAGRFAQSKIGPVPGIVVDTLLMGKDFMGRPIDGYYVGRQVIPLALSDIKSAMEEQGIAAGTIFSTLGIFGLGLQTYDQRR